jgi:hypothetical protein
MTDSSHDLVAAKSERIWEILRIIQARRDVDTTARQPDSPPTSDDDGISSPAWQS